MGSNYFNPDRYFISIPYSLKFIKKWLKSKTQSRKGLTYPIACQWTAAFIIINKTLRYEKKRISKHLLKSSKNQLNRKHFYILHLLLRYSNKYHYCNRLLGRIQKRAQKIREGRTPWKTQLY